MHRLNHKQQNLTKMTKMYLFTMLSTVLYFSKNLFLKKYENTIV